MIVVHDLKTSGVMHGALNALQCLQVAAKKCHDTLVFFVLLLHNPRACVCARVCVCLACLRRRPDVEFMDIQVSVVQRTE